MANKRTRKLYKGRRLLLTHHTYCATRQRGYKRKLYNRPPCTISVGSVTHLHEEEGSEKGNAPVVPSNSSCDSPEVNTCLWGQVMSHTSTSPHLPSHDRLGNSKQEKGHQRLTLLVATASIDVSGNRLTMSRNATCTISNATT